MKKQESQTRNPNIPEKITGFIEAISQIEGYHIMERQSGGIPGDLHTTKNKIEYAAVGFWSVVKTMGASFIVVPICIGAFFNLLPVYGANSPSFIDRLIIIVMSLSFCLGYAIFMARLGNIYEGHYTKSMIRNFLSGVAAGVGLKIVLAMGVFHYIGLFVLEPAMLEHYLLKLQGVASWDVLNWWFVTLLQWKNTFLVSAWYLSITTAAYIIVPVAAIGLKVWSDKKKEALGGRRL